VQFRLADIYLPDPVTVVYELHRDDLLRGQVIEMSEVSDSQNTFVVVAVPEFPYRMIVPIHRVVIEK